MSCLNCGNCKQGDVTYYCLEKDEIIVDENANSQVIEKTRDGWKKGDPEYEIHRRKSRKEVEV